MKTFGIIAALLAFVLCFAGGWVIFQGIEFAFLKKDNMIWAGMGLYFIGKAVFVGAMLVIASRKL